MALKAFTPDLKDALAFLERARERLDFVEAQMDEKRDAASDRGRDDHYELWDDRISTIQQILDSIEDATDELDQLT